MAPRNFFSRGFIKKLVYIDIRKKKKKSCVGDESCNVSDFLIKNLSIVLAKKIKDKL